jgi:hypothetical protein
MQRYKKEMTNPNEGAKYITGAGPECTKYILKNSSNERTNG